MFWLPRRHAVALLDRCEQRALRSFKRAAARDDGRGAPFGEELIERETKTMLAAIGADGRARIMRLHQGGDRGGADALSPGLAGELLLPGFEATWTIAALRRLRVGGEGRQRRQRDESGRRKPAALGH